MSPTFRYRAVAPDGKTVRGRTEAQSLGLARAALRDEGLLVLEVTPSDQPVSEGSSRSRGRASMRSVAAMARHLGVLLRGGVPLGEAIESLVQTTRDHRLQRILREVHGAILQGESLSQVCERFPACFDRIFVSIVRSGEAGGSLDASFLHLAGLLDKRLQMRSRMVSALTYPAITFLFGMAIVVFLLISVIPQITETLLSQQQALPFATDLLISSSEMVKSHAIPLAVIAVLLGISVRIALRSPRGRHLLDRLTVRVPGLGSMVKKQAMSRFTTVLGSLLRSGIPLLDSLRLTRGTVGNTVYAIDLERVHTEVLEGADLSRALASSPLYPPDLAQLVAIGEKSGALDSQLLELGGLLEEEVGTAMQRFADILAPAVTVVLGILVAFVMAAIITPLASFGDF